MTRRRALPGADELFRATGGPGPAAVPDDTAPHLTAVEERTGPVGLAPIADLDEGSRAREVERAAPIAGQPAGRGSAPVRAPVRRRAVGADRHPTGRERHEEKITVYVSAEELLDLEQARLTLRADHGVAIDRGRIVREALAVVLADLDAKGESSILVRRLRGR